MDIFVTKISYVNVEVNCTEPSRSVSVPCFFPFKIVSQPEASSSVKTVDYVEIFLKFAHFLLQNKFSNISSQWQTKKQEIIGLVKDIHLSFGAVVAAVVAVAIADAVCI